MLDLSIIISTKDRLKYLQSLISSIQRNSNCEYEIIVVDDASGDGTGIWCITNGIKYIRNNKSVPVATAWNQGAEISEGHYLVFLNDDMTVDKEWDTSQIILARSSPMMGALAFKVFDDEGNIQSRGHSFQGLQPYLPPEGVVEVDYSDHPFVAKRMWKYVGGFTAHGHMYYEDADFGLKFQSRGYKNYYNPQAILRHLTVGLRTGSAEDKEKRKFNEEVIQQEAKESFFSEWETYLIAKSR